jgi:hypothetical protein
MSKRNIKLSVLSVFLISSVFVLSGCGNKDKAQEQKQNQNQEQNKIQTQAPEQKRDGTGNANNGVRGGNPPAEMTEICSGKTEGDSCEVTMPARNGEEAEAKKMTGTCKKMGNSETLSCMPTNMPQGGPRGGTAPAE